MPIFFFNQSNRPGVAVSVATPVSISRIGLLKVSNCLAPLSAGVLCHLFVTCIRLSLDRKLVSSLLSSETLRSAHDVPPIVRWKCSDESVSSIRPSSLFRVLLELSISCGSHENASVISEDTLMSSETSRTDPSAMVTGGRRLGPGKTFLTCASFSPARLFFLLGCEGGVFFSADEDATAIVSLLNGGRPTPFFVHPEVSDEVRGVFEESSSWISKVFEDEL
mmetsp:Transcript_32103/g.63684  ORF Transcript_32103/g.63684 Transcript_32103/m.63684 type:complete len:222 (+) Transcript_32103:127-792(+)